MKEQVLPCGGPEGWGAGCRDVFCPDKKDKVTESCKSECRKHPTFCADTCEKKKSGWESSKSPTCVACLDECEAWCECQDYCEPLTKDAALCVEQGGRWGAVIQQNFNNILNSLVTLFEISTTEGWVDVMYTAVDARSDYYEYPIRDHAIVWAFAFTLFIFFSNMFFLNLSVGVIVEQFISLREEAKMINDDGAVYQPERGSEEGILQYFCGRPLSKCGGGEDDD